MSSGDYLLDAARRSYTPSKRWAELESDFPSFLLWRPLSLRLTPMAVRLGLSPTTITLSTLVVAAVLPPLAWLGGPSAYLGVALLAACHHVLDCLDGNVARTTGRTSGTGALLDGFGDLVFWALYFLAIGLLAQQAGGGLLAANGAAVGLGLVVLVLLHRSLRDAYELRYRENASYAEAPPERIGLRTLAWWAAIGMERSYVFWIVLAGLMGAFEALLAAIGLYVVLVFVGAVWLTLDQARAKDARASSGSG